jgi:peptide/nickel transport system permease protein
MRRNRFFVIGIIVTVVLILSTFLAPLYIQFNPIRNSLRERLMPPEFSRGLKGHILGTDALGRDVFTRLVIGGRYSFTLALSIVLLQTIIGTSLGILAGYVERFDTVIMRICDMFLALPNIVLAIAVIAVLGTSTMNLIIVLTISGWVPYCRVIRNNVLVLKKHEFVQASKAFGGSHLWIMKEDLFPNVTTPLIVLLSQRIGMTILIEASLSFLNLGIQPPIPSWGNMIADGRQYLATCPWLCFAPGIALMFTALAFNFLGDGLRDVLDPKTL